MTAELFPLNYQRFTHAGIPFTWNREQDELLVVCPRCGGNLDVHPQHPWHFCFGKAHCPTRSMTFGQLLNALVEKMGKA